MTHKQFRVKNKQAYFGGLITNPDTTAFVDHLSELSTEAPSQQKFESLEAYLDIKGKQTEIHR